MMRIRRPEALVPALLAAAIWAGCDSESGFLVPNQPPNTRVSAGPPEASDTSFRVNLFWFGWDDDGFVDHYEIAWETPDNWEGPIFGNDSLFVVQARDSCCVDPLPEYPVLLPDSVYQQYHTFYVRAVDNRGVPDETPAFRSFNAKTIAPYTEIVDPSPGELGPWGTQVEFNWVGKDDDGVVVGYRYALTTLEDYLRDTGDPAPNAFKIIAWLDTITYYPDFAGGYFRDSVVWRFTAEDSVFFPSVNTTIPPNQAFFAVRAIDDAGAEERILTRAVNTRFFSVTRALNGPCISMVSNLLGTWHCSDPPETRDVFAGQGLKFEWRATPGPSGVAVAGFSVAIDDTSQWSPFSLTNTKFPEQPVGGGEEVLWFPDEGAHTFFVRAIDEGGFLRVLAAQLRVFQGPRFCPASSRYVLVVLDTSPESLQNNFIWPLNYEEIELGLIRYYFAGYNFQVHETLGLTKPAIALMDCASSVFWFHSTDVREGDTSILQRYHALPPNPLPSYVASGGNLFVCGLQPLWAIRYFENELTGEVQFVQNDPVNFRTTVTDTTLVDHWAATQFGIAQIQESIGNTNPAAFAAKRLRTCRSRVRTGANPYPDLAFDPLTWPSGPLLRGFGYYDRGIRVIDTGDPQTTAQPIYVANDSEDAVAIRRLTSPGVNGNLIYVGFHPYFVERPAFRQFIRAVLTDFGEFPVP